MKPLACYLCPTFAALANRYGSISRCSRCGQQHGRTAPGFSPVLQALNDVFDPPPRVVVFESDPDLEDEDRYLSGGSR